MTQDQETGMVEAVLRAMKILDLFSMETPHLGLSDVARAAGIAKTTTLRLLRTLEACNYVVQTPGAQWRLGSAAASLGGRYQMVFDIRESIEPALRDLSDKTGLSTSFFVRDGKQRVRLVKVLGHDAPHGRSRVGDSMPLDRGSPGRVILAALGEPGSLYDEIRARGYHLTIGEAKQASASIAAPVFGSRWRVVGALCIGAVSAPGVHKRLLADVPDLMRAAGSLSAALSFANDESGRQAAAVRTAWYPS